MGLPVPEANNVHAKPSPQYDDGYGFDSGDELSDTDLNLFHTDYALQRDLTFIPARQPYNPSIPPSLRYVEDIDDLPRKYRADTYESNGHQSRPPQNSSLHQKTMYDGSADPQLPYHNARAYQTHRKRRPLIDLIRNEWQNNTSSSPPSPGYSNPNWLQVLTAPRFKRYIYVILVLVTLTWGPWHYWGEPKWSEHRLLSDSLEDRMRTGDGWFGINLRPEFVGMVQVKTLDTDLIPAGKGNRRRLIIVGDVHGCNDECEYPRSLCEVLCSTSLLLMLDLGSGQTPLRSPIRIPHRPYHFRRRLHLQRPLLLCRRRPRHVRSRLMRPRQPRRSRPARLPRPVRAPHDARTETDTDRKIGRKETRSTSPRHA